MGSYLNERGPDRTDRMDASGPQDAERSPSKGNEHRTKARNVRWRIESTGNPSKSNAIYRRIVWTSNRKSAAAHRYNLSDCNVFRVVQAAGNKNRLFWLAAIPPPIQIIEKSRWSYEGAISKSCAKTNKKYIWIDWSAVSIGSTSRFRHWTYYRSLIGSNGRRYVMHWCLEGIFLTINDPPIIAVYVRFSLRLWFEGVRLSIPSFSKHSLPCMYNAIIWLNIWLRSVYGVYAQMELLPNSSCVGNTRTGNCRHLGIFSVLIKKRMQKQIFSSFCFLVILNSATIR